MTRAAPRVKREARVALVIPAHNEQAGILAAMRSVDAQTRLPERRIVICDNCTDATPALARAQAGWEVWKTTSNAGKKGGALNQAWDRLRDDLSDDDFLVTLDADTLLDPHFVANACDKYRDMAHKGHKLGGVCANFRGVEHTSALAVLQAMEYGRAACINRSRRGTVPVLAGAATMFSVEALRVVSRSRGRLYQPVLTEDYELSLALRVHGYETMAPRTCRALTDLMPTARLLWQQRLRWYRGAFEALRHYGLQRHIRSDIGWMAFSMWAAASRWLFLLVLVVMLLMHHHMTVSPALVTVFALASLIRMVQVRDLGWRYALLAGAMVEELYYAFFLEVVLWRSAYLAFFAKNSGRW